MTGSLVMVMPKTDDDPLALEWKGRLVTVERVRRADSRGTPTYVRVVDKEGQRGTFRIEDLEE